jgi:YD repeat-containing protein
MKRAAKPKKSKRKQTDLPGVEGPGISEPHVPEIEDIAEQYVDVRDRRMALTKQECDAKGRLITVMHNHNITRYTYDGKVVLCEPGKEKLKVSTVNGPDDLDNEDD